MLVLPCTVVYNVQLYTWVMGVRQVFVLCFCKERLKNVFFFQVKRNKERCTVAQIGCSVAQTVVRRSPVWQVRRGSNLGPAPHGRLFLLSDSKGFSRGSRRFFSGFSLNIINLPKGSAKLLWAEWRALSTPFCVLKSLKRRVSLRTAKTRKLKSIKNSSFRKCNNDRYVETTTEYPR